MSVNYIAIICALAIASVSANTQVESVADDFDAKPNGQTATASVTLVSQNLSR